MSNQLTPDQMYVNVLKNRFAQHVANLEDRIAQLEVAVAMRDARLGELEANALDDSAPDVVEEPAPVEDN